MSGVAFGYAQSAAVVATIETDVTTTQNLQLDALPRFDVTGVVTAASDGAPIEGASVKAIGTPVDPAITDAAGAYTLNLPIGSYTLRATAGGCTDEGFEDIELVDADLVADFTIARKIDDFGHGCSPIAFDWVDAGITTPLFGDEFVGRLEPAVRLPVLRRDVRRGLAQRQRLPELPRPGPVQLLPGRDPVRVRPERGDLCPLAGPACRLGGRHQVRDGRDTGRTRHSSSSTRT